PATLQACPGVGGRLLVPVPLERFPSSSDLSDRPAKVHAVTGVGVVPRLQRHSVALADGRVDRGDASVPDRVRRPAAVVRARYCHDGPQGLSQRMGFGLGTAPDALDWTVLMIGHLSANRFWVERERVRAPL